MRSTPTPRAAFLVFAVLEDGAERDIDGSGIDLGAIQCEQRLGPVDGLGDAWRLVELEPTKRFHGAGDLSGEQLGDLRHFHPQDRELPFKVGVLDPVVEATPLRARRGRRACGST